jgi:RTX calcium-binding nonapeptide repeat (4 copies)
MRRTALLLVLMASVLLAASGVAWAVTKTCPPSPAKICWGTSGADVLKGTSKDNLMAAKGGNDTYTNFARGNSGDDVISDGFSGGHTVVGGRDKLLLTNYRKSEISYAVLDQNGNGKADGLGYILGSGGQSTQRLQTWDILNPPGKNTVHIANYYDDTRSKPPFRRGRGYIESIWVK